MLNITCVVVGISRHPSIFLLFFHMSYRVSQHCILVVTLSICFRFDLRISPKGEKMCCSHGKKRDSSKTISDVLSAFKMLKRLVQVNCKFNLSNILTSYLCGFIIFFHCVFLPVCHYSFRQLFVQRNRWRWLVLFFLLH